MQEKNHTLACGKDREIWLSGNCLKRYKQLPRARFHGGPSYRFKQLPESQISRSLPEASVRLLYSSTSESW